MKRLPKIIVAWLLVICLLAAVLPSVFVQAASREQTANQAFARGIAYGKIKYNARRGSYGFFDVDRDGVKELIITDEGVYTFWKYAKGKISKLTEIIVEFTFGYDKKTKMYWEWGEGDGGWIIGYKFSGGKFKKSGIEYHAGYDLDIRKMVAKKIVKGKTYRISQKKYTKIWEGITNRNDFHLKKGKKVEVIQNLLRK